MPAEFVGRHCGGSCAGGLKRWSQHPAERRVHGLSAGLGRNDDREAVDALAGLGRRGVRGFCLVAQLAPGSGSPIADRFDRRRW